MGFAPAADVRLPTSMAGIVLYFQLHQPHRLRRYSVFDTDHKYFDEQANAEICRKVADKCYRPATQMLLDLARRWQGRFKVSLSITGILLEQLERHAPDVIVLLQELVRSGSCELLGETYHHSLASLYWPEEFAHQVEQHGEKVRALFGVEPGFFRNTELIHSDDIAAMVASLRRPDGSTRFRGLFTEAATPDLAAPGGCGKVYAPAGSPSLRLLVRNPGLSDDVAFRFGNKSWEHWPLTAEKYAAWLIHAARHGLATVCMDFETFGEHQWAETGIFRFMHELPGEVFRQSDEATFLTPTQAIEAPAAAVASVPRPVSWADAARDLSAWRGNAMQVHALDEAFRLGRRLHAMLAGEPRESQRAETLRGLMRTWRSLTTSDHFYYMSTKGDADGAVHAYFRAFESPYDACIAYMNVLKDLERQIESA